MKPFKTLVISALVIAFSVCYAHGQKVFFGNLHSHTSYSDGSETPEKAYAYARDVAGIDFLAITEHNHAQAGRIARDHELYNGTVSTSLISSATRFTEDNRFVAIYGQEFSTIGSGNHGNVFEVNDVISTSEVPNGRWDKLLNEWLVTHKDSENKDAIILFNHPSISDSPNEIEYGIDDFNGDFDAWRNAIGKHVSLINIINGPSHGGVSPGRPSESEFKRYLNMGLHVAPTADQDNHKPNWGDAADTRTGVIAASLTKADILKALRERNVYASEDKNLEIIATVNDQLMGRIFRAGEVPSVNSQLDFRISIKDPDEPDAQYEIEVFADQVGGNQEADVIKKFSHLAEGANISLSGITYSGGNQYFFLRIRQSNLDGEERNRAWTAPVWFEPGSPTALPNSIALTLKVDEIGEMATITNLGNETINLKGWVLVSVKGNQRFTFTRDTQLRTNSSITIVSSPSASARPGTNDVVWLPKMNIWNNSGDPGQLLDPDGNLRAEDPEDDEPNQ